MEGMANLSLYLIFPMCRTGTKTGLKPAKLHCFSLHFSRDLFFFPGALLQN